MPRGKKVKLMVDCFKTMQDFMGMSGHNPETKYVSDDIHYLLEPETRSDEDVIANRRISRKDSVYC